MLYGGVGWIRPTRIAPEASPEFSFPGGSLPELTDFITEVPLNPRIFGLGCACDRTSLKGASAMLDRNRRESLEGFRSGWSGLGSEFQSSGACIGPQMSGTEMLQCEAVERANWFIQEALAITEEAIAIGGPGMWPSFAAYQNQFDLVLKKLHNRSTVLGSYSEDMPYEVYKQVEGALNEANNTIFSVRNGSDAGILGTLRDTIRQMPLFTATVVTETGEVVGELGTTVGQLAGDAYDWAKSFGKWVTVALVAALGLYGLAVFKK